MLGLTAATKTASTHSNEVIEVDINRDDAADITDPQADSALKSTATMTDSEIDQDFFEELEAHETVDLLYSDCVAFNTPMEDGVDISSSVQVLQMFLSAEPPLSSEPTPTESSGGEQTELVDLTIDDDVYF